MPLKNHSYLNLMKNKNRLAAIFGFAFLSFGCVGKPFQPPPPDFTVLIRVGALRMMLSERCWPVAIRMSEVLPAYARQWRRRLALSNVCFVRDFDTKTVGVGHAHLKIITGL